MIDNEREYQSAEVDYRERVMENGTIEYIANPPAPEDELKWDVPSVIIPSTGEVSPLVTISQYELDNLNRRLREMKEAYDEFANDYNELVTAWNDNEFEVHALRKGMKTINRNRGKERIKTQRLARRLAQARAARDKHQRLLDSKAKDPISLSVSQFLTDMIGIVYHLIPEDACEAVSKVPNEQVDQAIDEYLETIQE